MIRGMVVLVASVKFEGSGPSNLTLPTRPYHASSQNIPSHIEITLRNKARM